MELLGYYNTDRPIVAFQKDSIRFFADAVKEICPKRAEEDEDTQEKVCETV